MHHSTIRCGIYIFSIGRWSSLGCCIWPYQSWETYFNFWRQTRGKVVSWTTEQAIPIYFGVVEWLGCCGAFLVVLLSS